MEQEIKFCVTPDGVRIAYSALGQGPTMVRAAHYLSHLQFDLESPVWQHWIRELSKYHTYVRYDERGNGLSDREVPDFSFDAWVRDLESVVDSLRLNKFELFGMSQGGAVGIAYAARHPEKVSQLILYGSYALGWAKRRERLEDIKVREAMHKLIELGWGRDEPTFRQMYAARFIPGASSDQMRWFTELQRVSTSPENAAKFDIEFGNIDISDIAPKVSVPTLILHSQQDQIVPFEYGRQLAALIPNAKFVPLESKNHILLEGEPAWAQFLYEVRKFLGVKQLGSPKTSPGYDVPLTRTETRAGRRLAAIMFTDLVGYAALTDMDEARALELLREHRSILRPIIVARGGREVKTMGDAFLVEFESALEATNCALEMQKAIEDRNRAATKEHRLRLRIGIHLGDVIHSEEDVYGDAVNIASRIEPLATPHGICVTRQVYDQVRNKLRVPLVEVGPQELKNISSPVEVYRVVMPWGGTNAGKALEKRRLAILPFSNISPDPSDEYFADGLTDELITTVSKIPGLSVISRTSAVQYKKSPKRVDEIARELGSGSILEGTVRKAGNSIRVTTQLIDAQEDKHVWAESYDREFRDVFSIQSDIAQKVAEALKIKLLTGDVSKLGRAPTDNTEAYTLYLKGLYYVHKTSPSDIEKAMEYFELAIEQDPNFAQAYAWLSSCYTFIADESMPGREAFPKARKYATRALELNENLAEAHNSLGLIALQYDWDWPETDRRLSRATTLDPNFASAHLWYGTYLAMMRRFDSAFSEVKKAEALDPAHEFPLRYLAGLHMRAGENEKAEESLLKAAELDPNSPRILSTLAVLYTRMSRYDEAVRYAERATEVSKDVLFRWFSAYVFASAGRKEEALVIIREMIGLEKTERAPSFQIAIAYFALGEKEQGFKWLERAYRERSSFLPWTHDFPWFDKVKKEPRFVEMMRKIGLDY